MRHKSPSHLVIFRVADASISGLRLASLVAQELSQANIPFTVVEEVQIGHRRAGFCVYMVQNPGSQIFQDQQKVVYDLVREHTPGGKLLVVSPERTAHFEYLKQDSDDTDIVSAGVAEFFTYVPEGVTSYVKFPGGNHLVLR